MSAIISRVLPVLLSISIVFHSCSYSNKAATALFEKAEKKSYDMIIVPGVPFYKPAWDRVMKGRVYWAKYLFDKGIAKNIMFSGSSVYTSYNEARIMAMYAIALGVPAQNVFTEEKAEHSTENLFYSYKKARQLGFRKIALASDHFQTKSLRRYAHKRVSPDIAMIPFVMSTIRRMDPEMITPEINFQEAFTADFISIRKRESLFKRLRGTWGKNVDTTLYNEAIVMP